MRDPKGNEYEVGETIALCRCGQSGTKPFCDGAHQRTTFTALDRGGRPGAVMDGEGARTPRVE